MAAGGVTVPVRKTEIMMVSVQLWLAFVLAAAVVLVIPGPTIILVISQAVAHGRKSVVPLVVGVLCGDFTAMTLSLLGLGAILSASAALFSVFKWIGALYLIYLGVKLWQRSPRDDISAIDAGDASARTFFKRSFIVTALNPKSIAFFVAFLPQFVQPHESVFAQLTMLGGTFLFLATINATLYAVFAGRLREKIGKKAVRKWVDRCGGSALIGAGVFAAGIRRAS